MSCSVMNLLLLVTATPIVHTTSWELLAHQSISASVQRQHNHNDNHLMALYSGQPGWAGTRTLRNINPIYHSHCPQVPHNHSQPSLPGLTVYLWCLWLRRNRESSGEKHEEPEDKNPHVFYTRLILDLMRPLVNHWSTVTHACPCVTRPLAGLQQPHRWQWE